MSLLVSMTVSLAFAYSATASVLDLRPLTVSRSLEVDRALFEDLVVEEARRQVGDMPDEQLLAMVQQLLRSRATATAPPVVLPSQPPADTRQASGASTDPPDLAVPLGRIDSHRSLPSMPDETGRSAVQQKQRQQQQLEERQRKQQEQQQELQQQQQQQQTQQNQENQEFKSEVSPEGQNRVAAFTVLQQQVKEAGRAAASVAGHARDFLRQLQGQEPLQAELPGAATTESEGSSISITQLMAQEQRRQEQALQEAQRQQGTDSPLSKSGTGSSGGDDGILKTKQAQQALQTQSSAAAEKMSPFLPDLQQQPDNSETTRSSNMDSVKAGSIRASFKDPPIGEDLLKDSAEDSQLDSPSSVSNPQLAAAILGVPAILAAVLPVTMRWLRIGAPASSQYLQPNQRPDPYSSLSSFSDQPSQSQELPPQRQEPPQQPRQQQGQQVINEVASASSDGVLWRREDPQSIETEDRILQKTKFSTGASLSDSGTKQHALESSRDFRQLPSPWDDPEFYNVPASAAYRPGDVLSDDTATGTEIKDAIRPAAFEEGNLPDGSDVKRSSTTGVEVREVKKSSAASPIRRASRRDSIQAALLDNVEDDEILAAESSANHAGVRVKVRQRQQKQQQQQQ